MEQMVVGLARIGDDALLSIERIQLESEMFFAKQTKTAEQLDVKLETMNERQMHHLEQETEYFARANVALEFQHEKLETMQQSLRNFQLAMNGFVRILSSCTNCGLH